MKTDKQPFLVYNQAPVSYFTIAFGIVIVFMMLLVSIIIRTTYQGDICSYNQNSSGKPTMKFLVCYYTFNSSHLVPELIDTSLCTHIIGGFAGVNASNFNLTMDDEKIEILKRLRNATIKNDLKLMLTVGGGGPSGFSAIVRNHSSRLTFIRSLMSAVRENKLDGVDIDWEWPVLDGGSSEKVKFIQLLQEIGVEFRRHKKKYLLSAAVAAVESIIDTAYYVQHLAEHVDFINVMSYDYHFFTKVFPITDYNAPLFPDPDDIGGILENLNINYTIHYWINSGMPKEKIMLGVPTYGHSFRLRSSTNHNRHSPAEGFGFGDGGYVNYKDVCDMSTLTWDNASKVPYAYHSHDWISFDNRESVTLKTELAMDLGLGGIMVYSMNADDYNGECHRGEKFPLIRAIRQKLLRNYKL